MAKWWRYSLAAFLIVVASAAIIFVAGLLTAPPASVALHGTVTIGAGTADLSGLHEGDVCAGRSEFADLTDGARVNFFEDGHTDQTGTTTLDIGHLDAHGNCVLSFTVDKLTKVRTYTAAIASRPQQHFTYDKISSAKFTLSFTYGELSTQTLAAKTDSTGYSSKHYKIQDNQGQGVSQ